MPPLCWQQSDTACYGVMFTACTLLIFCSHMPWTSPITVWEDMTDLVNTERKLFGVKKPNCIDFTIAVLIRVYWCTITYGGEYNLAEPGKGQQHVTLQHIFRQRSVGNKQNAWKQNFWLLLRNRQNTCGFHILGWSGTVQWKDCFEKSCFLNKNVLTSWE